MWLSVQPCIVPTNLHTTALDLLLPCALQAYQLLKLGIIGFLFDFWTWFFDGNCATYIQALPNFTNTINAMPNLGYKCAMLCCSLPPFRCRLLQVSHKLRSLLTSVVHPGLIAVHCCSSAFQQPCLRFYGSMGSLTDIFVCRASGHTTLAGTSTSPSPTLALASSPLLLCVSQQRAPAALGT